MRADQIECGEIANPFIERRRPLEIGERKVSEVIFRRWSISRLSALNTSRKVWLDNIRLAVRNGLRLPSSSWSASAATKTVGRVRVPDWLSSESRNGPGRKVMDPVGGCALL